MGGATQRRRWCLISCVWLSLAAKQCGRRVRQLCYRCCALNKHRSRLSVRARALAPATASVRALARLCAAPCVFAAASTLARLTHWNYVDEMCGGIYWNLNCWSKSFDRLESSFTAIKSRYRGFSVCCLLISNQLRRLKKKFQSSFQNTSSKDPEFLFAFAFVPPSLFLV